MKYFSCLMMLLLSSTVTVCALRIRNEDAADKNKIHVNKRELTTKKVSDTSKNTDAPNPTIPSHTNKTEQTTKHVGVFTAIIDNKGMLMRTFYVLLGVSSIVIIYFVIRAWRTRRRHGKSRKYGLITHSGADLEMEPLDKDVDDDDEMTMFERRK